MGSSTKLVLKPTKKILAEAIDELKEKEFKELYSGTEHEKKEFLKETVIDTDFELLFPDDYINNISERLNLYTQLNALKTEEELAKFEAELEDRFGPLPVPAIDLLNSIRIKWLALKMGLERVVLKKKRFVGYFISDQQSGFYQSPAFGKVLQFVQQNHQNVSMKEKQTRTGLRLILSIEHVPSVEKVLKILSPFA